MKLEDLLDNITRTDVLRAFGLGPRMRDYIVPAIGLFAAGVLVGAGTTLLLAPKSGARLREDVADQLRSRLEALAHRVEQMVARAPTDSEAQAAAEHEGEAQGQRMGTSEAA